MRILVVLGVVVVAGVWRLWWWITRHVDHRESVSQEWRDAHGRDQGTKGGFR